MGEGTVGCGGTDLVAERCDPNACVAEDACDVNTCGARSFDLGGDTDIVLGAEVVSCCVGKSVAVGRDFGPLAFCNRSRRSLAFNFWTSVT